MGSTLSSVMSFFGWVSVNEIGAMQAQLDELEMKRAICDDLTLLRSANGSNSGSEEQSHSELRIPIAGVKAERLVRDCIQSNDSTLRRMATETLTRVSQKVTIPFEAWRGEVSGLHPRHHEQLEAIFDEVRHLHPTRSIYRGAQLHHIPSKHPSKSAKIPDFLMGYSNTTYLALLVDEVKLPGDIERGIRQSLSYAAHILLHRLEACRSYNRGIAVYCIATDSELLAVGRIAVVNRKVRAVASLTPRQCLPLENGGLDALLAMLGASDLQLGHAPHENAVIDGHRVLGVLDLGGFSSVYLCRAPQGEEFVMKTLPFVHMVPKSLRDEAAVVGQIGNEVAVLRALHRTHCPFIPALSQHQSPTGSWLGIRDVVGRLREYVHPLSTKPQRNAFNQRLRDHLLSAVRHVHAQGFSHNDVRPDNVGVISGPHGVTVQLMDFGLATPLAGAVFHGFRGGLPYFHDEIAEAEPDAVIAVQAAHDFAAVSYVLYAVTTYDRTKARIEVPWGKDTGADLVEIRKLSMAAASAQVWTA